MAKHRSKIFRVGSSWQRRVRTSNVSKIRLTLISFKKRGSISSDFGDSTALRRVTKACEESREREKERERERERKRETIEYVRNEKRICR